MARGDVFTTIRSEGALLPADFLQKLVQPKATLDGLSPADYHLPGTEKLNEAASRAWNHLIGVWAAFQSASEDLKPGERTTTITREKWLLPLFQELGYGRLQAARAFEIEGKSYAISHAWQQTPMHLVGRDVDLDRRTPGVAGAARTSPHGLLQEFLNRSEGHLWGLVSNGLKLRLLRDNRSFTRQAFLEFDLAAMMDGQVFADFVLLWLVCHQSRVEGERQDQCWLEKWSEAAKKGGTRALDDLRDGVQHAIEALGRGFLKRPANDVLKGKLSTGTLTKQDYYRQLLREVYRLIFLFVAEDRELLLLPDATPTSRERYSKFYSASRLRALATSRRGTQHDDLWRGLSLVFAKLGSATGCKELALPALGSFLWSDKGTPDLDAYAIANTDLLDAIRALVFTAEHGIRRAVDYRNLGAEELGSVYESLLELNPDLNADAGTYELRTAAGHERKATGSYYTPTSLIESLLDSALDPVLDAATRESDAVGAILKLKVCDPACGSGHFLIAAAHRIAERLAAVRTGDEEPSPTAVRRALRDVVGHCLYGVDINPMAVELCKVNLWLEALEPGKPLSFLEHHIQCGNSLLGSTPALLANGIPDQAFEPIYGDDKEVCRDLKKRNKQERAGFRRLPLEQPWDRLGDFASELAELDGVVADSFDSIREKERRWEDHVGSVGYEFSRLWADSWCSAFVWDKARHYNPPPITEDTFRTLERNPQAVPKDVREKARQTAEEYQLFHWHLAFPGVLRPRRPENSNDEGSQAWLGGFDVILGNPPWETLKLQDKEWFSSRRQDIAEAANTAARDRLIVALAREDPVLFAEYSQAKRKAEGSTHLIGDGGAYPLCSGGDLNTFALFAELACGLVSKQGRVGLVLPTGIVTDDPYKRFFNAVLSSSALISVFDFENQKPHFAAVKRTTKFCLFTCFGLGSSLSCEAPEFLFFGFDVADLADQERRFALSAETIARINPNTKTCPVFRSRRDATLTGKIHNDHDVLVRENIPDGNPWGVDLTTLFHMSGDSELFRFYGDVDGASKESVGSWLVADSARWAPLYEQNLFHMYDHRFATYGRVGTIPSSSVSEYVTDEMHASADLAVVPRYWVAESHLQRRWQEKGLLRPWVIAFRQSARTVDSRTGIFCILPKVASGHSVHTSQIRLDDPRLSCVRLAEWNSFAWDYLFRQSLGGNNTSFFVVKQVASLTPGLVVQPSKWDESSYLEWLVPRVLELSYTAWDLEEFASDCGYAGPPFRWSEERRFMLRCELDAALFHLYLSPDTNGNWRRGPHETTEEHGRLASGFPTPRDAVAYMMETFPIVRRKDEAKWGKYRTKDTVLEVYDALAEATRSGKPYLTPLVPAPADSRTAHGGGE